jgi:hypothetical protein
MQLTMSGAQPKSDLYLVLFTHLFSLVVGLAAAGVTLWVIATHQLLTLDGLALVATSCGIATFFLGHTAWAVHTGEIRELLANLRGKPDQAPPEGASAPHDGK